VTVQNSKQRVWYRAPHSGRKWLKRFDSIVAAVVYNEGITLRWRVGSSVNKFNYYDAPIFSLDLGIYFVNNWDYAPQVF